MRPIDKSKKSARRCWNCKHYKEVNLVDDGPHIENRKFYCETGGCKINYWNSCVHFVWNPEKEYKEALKDGKDD